MNLEARKDGDALVINVAEDRIDAASAVLFKDRIRSLATEDEKRVILDLSRVQFLDSSGLGAIVATMKFLGQDRSLELAGLTPTVEKVFRLTRMDTVFTIHETVESGILPATRAS